MSKKEKIISVVLIVFTTILLGLTIGNKKNFSSMLKASVSENIVQDGVVIDAAKKMAQDNIDNIDEEKIYTIKDLVRNKYLTGNEINPVTNEEYNDDTRVVVTIKDNKIEDAYITNTLFKNKYSCKNVCYLDFDNYISFNNDTYRIMKIDQQGYIYITKNQVKKLKKEDINNYLKNLHNSYDKNIVNNVVNLSDMDIEKSNIISLETNTVVNTNSGYKMYNIDNEEIEDINSSEVTILPIIVLNQNITYVKGNGSKFNPYVLGE